MRMPIGVPCDSASDKSLWQTRPVNRRMAVAATSAATVGVHVPLATFGIHQGTAAAFVAASEALLHARAEGTGPDCVLFWLCPKDAAIVGFDQPIDLEVRERHALAQQIELARRMTGGGAVLVGPGQVLFSVIVGAGRGPLASEQIDSHVASISGALCTALELLGLTAVTTEGTWLSTQGRRIGCLWSTSSRGVLLLEGMLQSRFDAQRLVDCLRAPAEKMPHKDTTVVAQRWTDLSTGSTSPVDLQQIADTIHRALCTALDATPQSGDGAVLEGARFRAAVARFGAPAWVRRVEMPQGEQTLRSLYKTDGGFLWTNVRLDEGGRHLTSIQIATDAPSHPVGALATLAQRLEGCELDEASLDLAVSRIAQSEGIHLQGIPLWHLQAALRAAVERVQVAAEWGIAPAQANDLWVVPARPQQAREETLGAVRKADVLLMPFCTKALDCELRFTLDCTACGGCTTGVGYARAAAKGMAAVTLCNAEHFGSTLAAMKAHGATAYVGACCEPFYAKHRDEFERLGVPGVLVNIEKVTCYEVDIDRDDRNEGWQELADLKTDLLNRVLDQVEDRPQASTFEGAPVPQDVKRLRADQKVVGGGKRMSPNSPV